MTIIPVKIANIRDETSTVRVLTLDLMGQIFFYYAGQWIDCYAEIQDERKIVGYSLTSSPSTQDFVELAVKVSDNLVSVYVHENAQLGDTLWIEGGQGEIYYSEGMGDRVVLIAAGIGVAPLMGILRYIDDVTNAEVTLVQSATTQAELIYYQEIKERAKKNPRIKYFPTVTREDPIEGIMKGRISSELLDVLGIDLSSVFYLSGPGGMIPDLRNFLLNRGVDEKRIRYEVWW